MGWDGDGAFGSIPLDLEFSLLGFCVCFGLALEMGIFHGRLFPFCFTFTIKRRNQRGRKTIRRWRHNMQDGCRQKHMARAHSGTCGCLMIDDEL